METILGLEDDLPTFAWRHTYVNKSCRRFEFHFFRFIQYFSPSSLESDSVFLTTDFLSWFGLPPPRIVFNLEIVFNQFVLVLSKNMWSIERSTKQNSSPILNELTFNSQEIRSRVERMPIMPGDQVCHNIDSLWPPCVPAAAHFSPPDAPTDRVSPRQLPRRVLPGLAAPLPGARVSLPGLRVPLIPLPEARDIMTGQTRKTERTKKTAEIATHYESFMNK